MKLYQFIDDETHFIAARNEAEARACYLRDCTDEAPDDLRIVEISPEKWATIGVRDEDAPGGKTTAAEIIGDPTQERDAILVASSCY